MRRNILRILLTGTLLLNFAACEEAIPETEAEFTVTIRNLSEGEIGTLLSGGVYYTHRMGFPLFFRSSLDYGQGLEFLAEDGIVDTLLQNLENNRYIQELGAFPDLPEGGSEVSFTLVARYGDFLNFATMFTDSNDAFYSFDEEGIHLFEPNGDPVQGDVTDKVWLWDAGTEENTQPYVGEGQPGRGPLFSGVPERRSIDLINDQFRSEYPPRFQVIQVLISANSL